MLNPPVLAGNQFCSMEYDPFPGCLGNCALPLQEHEMFATSLISPVLHLWLLYWGSWLFFIWWVLGRCVVGNRTGVRYSGYGECVYSDCSIISATGAQLLCWEKGGYRGVASSETAPPAVT